MSDRTMKTIGWAATILVVVGFLIYSGQQGHKVWPDGCVWDTSQGREVCN